MGVDKKGGSNLVHHRKLKTAATPLAGRLASERGLYHKTNNAAVNVRAAAAHDKAAALEGAIVIAGTGVAPFGEGVDPLGEGGEGVAPLGEGVIGEAVAGDGVFSVPWLVALQPKSAAAGQLIVPVNPLSTLKSALPALPSAGHFTVVPFTVRVSTPLTQRTGKQRIVFPVVVDVYPLCNSVLSKQRLVEPYVSP